MTNGGVREGPARELIVDGRELDPAAESELTLQYAGFSGAVKMAGNGTAYKGSTPHPGRFAQDVSCDMDTFKFLQDLQSSGRFVLVSVTDAGNNTAQGLCAVHNDGPLELVNGVVSLEMAGQLEPL